MQNEEKYAKCTFLNQNKSNICKVYVFGSKTDLPLQNPADRCSKVFKVYVFNSKTDLPLQGAAGR